MYVYATIQSAYAERWTLPLSAVAKQGTDVAAFRLAEGKALRTLMQPGRSDAHSIEILSIQKAGSPPQWQPFDGEGQFALKSAGLTDGQTVTIAAAK